MQLQRFQQSSLVVVGAFCVVISGVIGCERPPSARVQTWYRAGFSVAEDDGGRIDVIAVSLSSRSRSSVSLRFPHAVTHLRVLNLGDLRGEEPFTTTVLAQTPRDLESLIVYGELSKSAQNVIRKRFVGLKAVAFHDSVFDPDDVSMLLDLPELREVDLRNAHVGSEVEASDITAVREHVQRLYGPVQK